MCESACIYLWYKNLSHFLAMRNLSIVNAGANESAESNNECQSPKTRVIAGLKQSVGKGLTGGLAFLPK